MGRNVVGPVIKEMEDPVTAGLGLQLGQRIDEVHRGEEAQFGDPLLFYVEGNDSLAADGPRLGDEPGDISVVSGICGSGAELANVMQVGPGPISTNVAHTNPGLVSMAVSGISALVNVNFGDLAMQPVVAPPVGFIWQFLDGVWAMFPDLAIFGATNVGIPRDQDRLDISRLARICQALMMIRMTPSQNLREICVNYYRDLKWEAR